MNSGLLLKMLFFNMATEHPKDLNSVKTSSGTELDWFRVF